MTIDFRRIKIGTLLSVGVVSIIGLMIAATVYSNYLTTNAQDIISSSTTRIFDVLTIQRDTEELFSAMQDIIVIQDQQRLEDSRDRIESLLERAQGTIREAGENEIFSDEELKKAEEVLSNAQEASESVIESKIDTIRSSGDDDGVDGNYFYERNIDSNEQLIIMRNLRFEMQGVFHDMTERSDEEYRGAMELVGRAKYITWFVIAISLVLAVSLAFFLVRSVKRVFDLKNEFVNIIAHDLRNPVTAITGYLEIMASDKNKKIADLHEDFLALDVSAQKLRNQISNLLEVGRTEAGRVKLNLETIQPFEIIGESVIRAKALAEISKIKIINKKTDVKNVYILADRSKLSDVLDNLISNAIKYNKENGTVTVSTQDAGETFNISVTDTGHGIPEDQKQKIFKRYSRLETDKSKGVSGTGLGLYTVKLSMEKMKGTVEFESKENEGTTFTISFNKMKKGE